MSSIRKQISDEVTEYFKHFGVYPILVEIGDMVYDWDSYWYILNFGDIDNEKVSS